MFTKLDPAPNAGTTPDLSRLKLSPPAAPATETPATAPQRTRDFPVKVVSMKDLGGGWTELYVAAPNRKVFSSEESDHYYAKAPTDVVRSKKLSEGKQATLVINGTYESDSHIRLVPPYIR